MKKIIIAGGGLAGLTASIQLAKKGFEVTLVEKRQYPFHRVCGEYISNEVIPFLHSLDIFPYHLGSSKISKLRVTSCNGNEMTAVLPLGGFGISRYKLDGYLAEKAVQAGVRLLTGRGVEEIFYSSGFKIKISDGSMLESDLVIGSYGKRSNIDRVLKRPFFARKSPYLGIKYHIKGNFAHDVVELHNFPGGYCGLNKVEEDIFCLCYLIRNDYLKKYKNVQEMEQNVLYSNPVLKAIFTSATFVFSRPESINEISFDLKSATDQNILMAGDAVGMISPLCGNGMAMAMHSSKLLCDTIIDHSSSGNLSPDVIGERYQQVWNKTFKKRIIAGKWIQKLTGKELLSEVAVSLLSAQPALTKYLISKTHGSPFS